MKFRIFFLLLLLFPFSLFADSTSAILNWNAATFSGAVAPNPLLNTAQPYAEIAYAAAFPTQPGIFFESPVLTSLGFSPLTANLNFQNDSLLAQTDTSLTAQMNVFGSPGFTFTSETDRYGTIQDTTGHMAITVPYTLDVNLLPDSSGILKQASIGVSMDLLTQFPTADELGTAQALINTPFVSSDTEDKSGVLTISVDAPPGIYRFDMRSATTIFDAPEPGTILLLACGILALASIRILK